MQESEESSLRLSTGSSGQVAGMPVNVSRESSSGASSDSRRRNANAGGTSLVRKSTMKPPLRSHTPEHVNPGSPGTASSLPSLEDRSAVPPLKQLGMEIDEGLGQGSVSSYSQHYHDLRVYHDQRSVHVHPTDPEMVGQLAGAAAANEVRAEAATVVGNIVAEATQAVSLAQMEATQAHALNEVTKTQAMSEINQLRGQLETTNQQSSVQLNALNQASSHIEGLQSQLSDAALREKLLQDQVQAMSEEIIRMKSLMEQTPSKRLELGSPSLRPPSPNGTDLLAARMIALEERVRVIEDQLQTQQSLLQEVWYGVKARAEPSKVASPSGWNFVDHSGGPKGNPPVHFHIGGDGEEGGSDEGGWDEEDEDLESKALRMKDLHHLKLPTLPASAAAYRTWRNSVRTAILAFDLSKDGVLTPWLTKAFNARDAESKTLAANSEGFPRLDRVIASVLCKQEVLTSSFGLRVQSYVEKCEMVGETVRGRAILNMVSSEFDTSHASTSITSSLELFQLPAPHDTAAGLKHWSDRVTYILSQLPLTMKPDDPLLSHWAYNSLKRHPLLRRIIDRYIESSSSRTFDFLWDGVVQVLRESQLDSNAQSIRDDLRKGPPASKKESKALPAQSSNDSSKGKGKSHQKGSKTTKAEGPKDKKDSKGKSSGKGNPKDGPAAPKASTQGGSPPPCIFHARGKCTRTNCPFSHDTPAASATAQQGSTTGSAKAQPKSSQATPKAKAVAAMVALMSGFGEVAGQSPVLGMMGDSGSSFSKGYVEFIGDTGAGECLGSPEALAKQGFALPESFFVETSRPLKFATGGGSQSGSSTIGCWSDDFKRLQNVYMLPQCPLALSIGQLCEEAGFSFVWPSDGIPFLVPPTSNFTFQVTGDTLPAHRVDHHVPVFRVSTEFVPGLPSAPSGGGGG